MKTKDFRDRYLALLLEDMQESRYPSPPMMDRLESAIRTRDEAEAYIEALLTAVGNDRYMSPPMLDRIARFLDRMDDADRVRSAEEGRALESQRS